MEEETGTVKMVMSKKKTVKMVKMGEYLLFLEELRYNKIETICYML